MRRLAALVALVLTMLGAGVGSAQAEGPQGKGWWSSLNHEGGPQAPTPADVGADDLLIQGGDPARLLPAGIVDQQPSPTAYAALAFPVPVDATVGGLTLPVAAGAQAADVRAYPTSSAWVPAQGGTAEQAPAFDPGRFSVGVLSADGASLVFRDIGRLVDEAGGLSVALLPGPADRVVIHPPPPTALEVTATRGTPSGPPAPSPSPTAAPDRPLPSAIALRPPFIGSLDPLTAAAPPAGTPAATPGVAPAPQSVPAAALRPTSAAAGRVAADDGRTRLLVALEALLVLVFFGLLGQGPLGVLSRLTGQSPAAAPVDRGVGRFRSTRTGSAPHL